MADQLIQPITKTIYENDLLMRFLGAAEARIGNYDNRVPLSPLQAKAAITWLRGLVDCLNEDGSLDKKARQ